MKLSLATIALSSSIMAASGYQIGGFDMFGRPVIVNPRVGRTGRAPCRPQQRGDPDCVDRAFQDLENELKQDKYGRQRQNRRRGPVGGPWMKTFPVDEESIRQQEEWVNRAFGLATDVAKGFASSPREAQEADEAIRQQKEWVDRFFGMAKDASSGGTWSSVNSEVLQDDDGAFQVALDVPGVKASNIDVTIEGTEKKRLVVRGQREVGKDEEARKFLKAFTLDARSDVEQVSVALENGVLVVTVPRRPYLETETPTQTIPVTQAFSDASPSDVDIENQPYKLELDVPGVVASNIDVVLEGEKEKQTLTVTAVRELGKDSDGKPRTKQITNSFKIDSLVDTDKIEVTLNNGVLTITAPKDEKKLEESVRKINITNNAGGDTSKTTPEKGEDSAVADQDESPSGDV